MSSVASRQRSPRQHEIEALSTPLPKISIVIPTLNMGRFLGQCFRSIVRQRYPNTEIIIVDGGSVDETHEVLNAFSSIVDKVIVTTPNGQPSAVTTGLRHATGDIAHWHAADDIVMPDAFWTVARTFAAKPEVDLIFSDGIAFTDTGVYWGATARWTTFWDSLLFFGRFQSDCAYWRHRITANGLPLDDSKPLMCDEDFFLRIWAGHRGIWVDRPLGAFRSHGDQVSRRIDPSSLEVDRRDTREKVMRSMGITPEKAQSIRRKTLPLYLLRGMFAPKAYSAARYLIRKATFDIRRREFRRWFFDDWLREGEHA